ncbi:PREDICTED: granzyme K [Hipposideros armiger]|uniref:Granzyme K n=1 Tax=Hipposideros armiger TaxID=186990 RepID=A0A8B7RBJ8_HIPAR|nr:PREDICTED: granzyme K [Hipposideros armiger]
MTKFSSFSLFFIIAGAYMTPECFNMEIIGGKEVSPHSRPFMASIQYRGNHICGGVLIHPQWVLTAAHCRARFGKRQSSKVVLGAHSLSKNEASKQTFEIIKFVPFPRSTSDAKSSDIMLVKLHTAAKLDKHVKLLYPSTKNDIRAGTKCQVTGWGSTDSELFSFSDTLREVTVTVISRKLCNSRSYYNHNPIITKGMICAGDAKGQKDSCQSTMFNLMRMQNRKKITQKIEFLPPRHLLEHSYLPVSITAGFQTHGDQNEIHNVKNFFHFSAYIIAVDCVFMQLIGI